MNKGLSVSKALSFSLIIVAVVIVFIGLLTYSYFQAIRKPELPKETRLVIPATKIVKETVDFIQTQRNPSGYYNYSSDFENLCDKFGCPNNGINELPILNAWTALAYNAAYRLTGDITYLDLAKNDLDKLIDSFCKNNTLKCIGVIFQVAEVYKDNKDEKYLLFIKDAGDKLLQMPVVVFNNSQVLITGIDARNLAELYDITKDRRYLDAAINRLEKSKSLWGSDGISYRVNNIIIYRNSCWTEVAEIKLYRVTNEKGYLINAQDFFNKAAFNYFERNLQNSQEVLSCVEGLLELFEITNQSVYLTAADSMLNNFLKWSWDSKENKIVFGKGAFLSLSPSALRSEVFADYKNPKSFNVLTDATYAVFILSKIGKLENFEFELRK